MTFTQKAIYKNLLNWAFFSSTRPYLPNDDDQLWAMANCKDKQEWLDNKEPVVSMFKETEGGLLEHPKVTEDYFRALKKSKDLHEKRVAAGRKGGLVKPSLRKQASATEA